MARSNHSPTIRDVAQRAGVSIQTVSNIINNRSFAMTPETRARVIAAMRELGYQPNYAARGLRGRAHAVGLLVVAPSPRFLAGAFRTELVAGLCDTLRERSVCLVVHSVPPDGDPAELFALFGQRRIDAAVVALSGPSAVRARFRAALLACGQPCVLLDDRVDAPHAVTVQAGLQQGAFEAVEHLIHSGHEHIGYVGIAADEPEEEQRFLGYKRALALWGRPFDPRLVAVGEASAAGGYTAAIRLLQQHGAPSAILAASDTLALGVLEAARATGRRVGEDLALIGFEDLEFAPYLDPPLASVRLPAYAMGQRAAQLLLGYLDEERFAERLAVFPTTLVLRRSAGYLRTPRPLSPLPTTDTIRFARPAPYTLGFANAGNSNPWRVLMFEQMQIEVRRHPEIARFEVRDAGDDVARQLEQIDELLRLGVDALIIGPAASHELVPAIARADDLGVPTILLGSRVPTDRYTVLVETDDVLVGKVAAEDLVRRMGPRGKVVIFEGPEGWAVADDRSRGMDLVLREYRDIVVVARRRTPQWSRARAKAMMRELLREHPRIDGVLAHDGLMMAGALEAAEEVGRANEMTFAWVGGYHGALRYIERTGQGTAALIPSWIGAECVRVALQVLRGEPVPKWRDMGTVIVNRDNLYDWYDPEKPDDTYESLLDR